MDTLDLLFRRLVLAARATGALERPVTVGEVLDDLVPYAAARRDGQLDSHDDYLHGLMRLVSGERSLLFGDDLMQDDLKAELDSPNPDLTVVRTYTHTKLRVSTEGIARVLAGDIDIDLRAPTPLKLGPRVSTTRATATSGATSSTGTTGTAARPESPVRPGTPAQPLTPKRGPTPSAGAVNARPTTPATPEPTTGPRRAGPLLDAFSGGDASRNLLDADGANPTDTADLGCPYCAQALSAERTFKYCPSCGMNLLVRRCPGCSSELEPGWKFCVTCGRQA